MIKEAEMHAEEDRRKREEAELRNQADNLIYTTEKTLRDSGNKLSSATKERVEKALSALKEAMKSEDIAEIRRKMEELQSASHVMAQELYQQTAQSATGGGEQEGSTGSSQEDVVDADYKVVDDEGK
jgi:molecular chaperone DnaK